MERDSFKGSQKGLLRFLINMERDSFEGSQKGLLRFLKNMEMDSFRKMREPRMKLVEIYLSLILSKVLKRNYLNS